MTRYELRDAIRRLMNKTGWGPKKLGQKAGLTTYQIQQFFYGETAVSMEVFYRMQDCLLDALKEKSSKS